MPTVNDAPRRFDFLGTQTQLLLRQYPTVLFTTDQRVQEIVATAFLAERGLRITYEDMLHGGQITQIALGDVAWNGIVRATSADWTVVALEPGPSDRLPVSATLSQRGIETTVTGDKNAYEVLRVAFRLQCALIDPTFNAEGNELRHALIEVTAPASFGNQLMSTPR